MLTISTILSGLPFPSLHQERCPHGEIVLDPSCQKYSICPIFNLEISKKQEEKKYDYGIQISTGSCDNLVRYVSVRKLTRFFLCDFYSKCLNANLSTLVLIFVSISMYFPEQLTEKVNESVMYDYVQLNNFISFIFDLDICYGPLTLEGHFQFP